MELFVTQHDLGHADWYKKTTTLVIKHLPCARVLPCCHVREIHGVPLLSILLTSHLVQGESPTPSTVTCKAPHCLVSCSGLLSYHSLPSLFHSSPTSLHASPSTRQAHSPLRACALAVPSLENAPPCFPMVCHLTTFAQMSTFQQGVPWHLT